MRPLGLAAGLILAAGASTARAGEEEALAPLRAWVRRSGIPEPTEMLARLDAARAKARSREYLEAARECTEAANLSPTHPLPYFRFAHAMLGLGSWREADDLLRKALAMYPGWRKLQVPPEADFASAEEWRERVRALESARGREPEGSPRRRTLAFLLGYAFLGSGERSKAKLAFAEAALGDPPDAEARNYLDDLAAAEAPAKPATPSPGPAGPEPEPDPFRRGTALFREGRYAEAADAFAEAVIENPGGMNGILAHFELCHALVAIGRFPEAETALRRGLRRYPDWGRVKMNRRDAYGPDRAPDFDEQRRKLETAARAKGDDARLWFLLGYNDYFIGRRRRAADWFRRGLARGPDPDASQFLALIEEAEGPLPPALPEAAPEPPAPVAGDPFEARLAAARAAFEASDWRAAAREVRAAFKITSPHSAKVRWKESFTDPARYDQQLLALKGEVEKLENFRDLDLRFLLIFSYLYSGRIERAVEQLNVHAAIDKDGTDAEARAYREILGVGK
ncbi:MAG: tetratricopeptide repeat protein [Planctomycetales bacterium]|nr:tetratricopeptide repeat protein [Planctomycetales bacterium]